MLASTEREREGERRYLHRLREREGERRCLNRLRERGRGRGVACID